MISMPCNTNQKNKIRGFSLLELAVSLTIIAMIAGAAISAAVTKSDNTQINQTNAKLDTIEKALAGYLAINGRLPCPARADVAITHANFGIEEKNGNNCRTTVLPERWNMRMGMVPVRTLQLPDDFALDGWKRRIAYITDKRLTNTPAIDAAENFTNQATVAGDIVDAAGIKFTVDAHYILVSYGINGYGAWNKNGGSQQTTSSDTSEQDNYFIGATGTVPNTNYVQKQQTGTFDDIVRYKTRVQLIRDTNAVIYNTNCLYAQQVINDSAEDKAGGVCQNSTYPNCPNFVNALANQVNELCLRP